MAVKVLIQGMRRSGTTIFFDLFFEDDRFDCHYEPLNAGRPALGGGSGAHDHDLNEKTRRLRSAFREREGLSLDPDAFNYGAPRDPRLEYETEFPEYIRRYLRFLLERADHTLIKFTRAMHKIAELRALAPGGFLIHVVRDPRLVATSYLFGKHQKNRHRFHSADTFFGRTTNKLAWSSYNFSELLLARPEYAPLRSRCTDLMRLLLLWAHNFQVTHRDGARLFGDRYLLVRHEDLLFRTDATITDLYRRIGMEAPERVTDWACRHVNARPLGYVYAEDARWTDALAAVGALEAMATASYDRLPPEWLAR
jgi:Sulfotransferase family